MFCKNLLAGASNKRIFTSERKDRRLISLSFVRCLLGVWISFGGLPAHSAQQLCSAVFEARDIQPLMRLERFNINGDWPSEKIKRSLDYLENLQKERLVSTIPMRNFNREAHAVRDSLIQFLAGMGWDIAARAAPLENIMVDESITSMGRYNWQTHLITVDTRVPPPATILHELIHSVAFTEVAPFTLIDGFHRIRSGFSGEAIWDPDKQVDDNLRKGGFGLLIEGFTEYLTLYIIQRDWPSIPILKDYVPFEQASYITASLFFEALVSEIGLRSGLSFDHVLKMFITAHLTGDTAIKDLMIKHFSPKALEAIAALGQDSTWTEVNAVMSVHKLLRPEIRRDIESRYLNWNMGEELTLRFPN